jgi:hypothetical protein
MKVTQTFNITGPYYVLQLKEIRLANCAVISKKMLIGVRSTYCSLMFPQKNKPLYKASIIHLINAERFVINSRHIWGCLWAFIKLNATPSFKNFFYSVRLCAS